MAPKIPSVILDPLGLADELGGGDGAIVERLKFEAKAATNLRKSQTDLRIAMEVLWTLLREESKRSEAELRALVKERLEARRKKLAAALRSAKEKSATAKARRSATGRKKK